MFFDEIVEVRVQGCNVFFRTSMQGGMWGTLDTMKLDKSGVIKEFPELADEPEWRLKAIEKFKDKIKSLSDEESRITYIIEDLKKYGYVPKYLQREGYRPQKIK